MFDKLTVLDVGAFLTGPRPARNLAEFGAEVIKVEKPSGDPFRYSDTGPSTDGVTSTYTLVNRGKKSIGIDLASDDGRRVLTDLARKADVLVENMSPGRMEKFGLGYDDIRAVNTEIIYCSVSGYGQTGPYAGRKSMDYMAQAMSGIPFLNSMRAGIDDPVFTGWYVVDELTGAYATSAILAAIVRGEGTYIDVSMLDSVLGSFTAKAASYAAEEEVGPPDHGTDTYRGPGGWYHTATDPLTIYILDPSEAKWLALWDALELDEWVENRRFVDPEAIDQNESLIEETVVERFESKPRDYWLDRLWQNDLTAAPLLTVEEAFEHEQIKERPVLSTEENEYHGSHLQLNFPAIYSAYDLEAERGPATLGEHTLELLERVGYDLDEIERLYDDDIVV